MANALYNAAKNAILGGNVDWINDTIKAVLIDTDDYTVDLATHANLNQVPAAARVATVALAGKSIANGRVDAADAVFSAVTGDECEAVIIYKDTGNEATSTLLAYIDESNDLPITPAGVDINLTMPAQGVFGI